MTHGLITFFKKNAAPGQTMCLLLLTVIGLLCHAIIQATDCHVQIHYEAAGMKPKWDNTI